ncbi:MAG: M20/M25/M40 family metallo-hydrolase [Clostridia bacterium]|nr:M20/M25/M40 family metallo-hydrolase [Clostridia bacterium]
MTMKFLLIIPAVLAVLLVLVLIAVVRTLFLKKKTSYYEMSEDTERINLYAEKLAEMVRYETVSVRGLDQADKFRGFHRVLENLFPNVFRECEKTDIDGNLLVKWPGKNPSLDPIILISHQDVVEASGEWKYPPFSGTIADGRIYGRGTGDIKSGVFAFYQAVDELIAAGYRPECDVYLGSSCTEEIGGDGAPKTVKWFKDRGIHLFMLCDEGGCIVENPVAGVKGCFAAIGIFEKGYGDMKFTARSNGGHSSTPSKNAPIDRLAKFENEVLSKDPFRLSYSPAFRQMFSNLAPYCSSFPLKVVMHNLWLFGPVLKRVMGSISAEAAAMLKTTVCFTMQKGSDGYNVIPQEAWVTANMRYIPHQGKDESNKIITDIARKYGIEAEFVTGNDCSKQLDLNGKPYELTVKALNRVFPTVGEMPYIVTGGTDSRFYDEVCDSCVKFSPVMSTGEQLKGMHGLNENIFTGVLPGAVDYYKEIIRLQETR